MESFTAAISSSARKVWSCTIALHLMVAFTSSLPLTSKSVTSSGSWMLTGAGRGRSHVMMWMFTEKQLLPRINGLADFSFDLLQCKCRSQGKSVEECLNYASNLTSADELAAFPSATVLKKEKKKKVFGKVLMEDAYKALKTMESMLSESMPGDLESSSDDCRNMCDSGMLCANEFQRNLQMASQQFGTLIKYFYGSKVPDKKEKKTRGRQTPTEGNTQEMKTLFLAYNRLNQIASVLEYSVELSWIEKLRRK